MWELNFLTLWRSATGRTCYLHHVNEIILVLPSTLRKKTVGDPWCGDRYSHRHDTRAGSWNTLKLLAGFTASLLQIFFITTCMLSQKFSPSAFSSGTCRYNRIFFKPTRRYKYSYYFFLLNPQVWWEGSCFFQEKIYERFLPQKI